MPKRVHTDMQREQALALYVEHGPSEAARMTGISKQTIASWARRRGVQTVAPSRTAVAIRAASERRKRTLEERRAVLVEKLGELAEMGVDWAAHALESGMEGLSLRDVVGVFTRAIHDLQLLSGGATARGEIELAGVAEVRRLQDELAERRAKRAV